MKVQNTAPGSPPEPREAVVYAELLSKAHEEGLRSIQTELVLQPTEDNGRLCIVKAAVEVERGQFEGLGDADPGSVEDFLAPHLIRVAETRAKARALRDAVNVGVVSFEELDGVSLDRDSSPGPGATSTPSKRSTPRRSSMPPRAANRGNGADGPMSEAQRRYLFRLLASQGYQGAAAEEYLKQRLGVQQIRQASRTDASALIDELLQSSAPARGAGDGAAAGPQR